MRIAFEFNQRRGVIFGTMLAMMAALFISRAALSICIILFLSATILHKHIGLQIKNFFKTPLLVGTALLFVLPFVSGLWSDNINEWSHLVRIKLPLLLLPLAFAGNWQLTNKQWCALIVTFILLITAGTIWSFEKYWTDQEAITESYLKAKVFFTPLQNDHVRFSWLVAIAALLCLWLIEHATQWLKWLAVVVLLWFIVYLHVLAARTGLFSLYFILLFYLGWKLVHRKKKSALVLVLGATLVSPLLAWQVLPTFQNRVKYFLYDYSFIKRNAYLPGGNDGARMLSYRAGWSILKTHPLGVGAGDVWDETRKWYAAHVPNMLPTDQLYPNSEWLSYGDNTGWIGVVLFTAVMLLPFFYSPSQHRFYWYALCGTAALTFIFDIGLEVQYGVFVYAFLVLWWWKWFSSNAAL